MEFVKQLSKSESKYKYIGLPKNIREENFPEKDELFDVKFKTKNYKMKVNNKNCIMLTPLYEIHIFEEGEILKIKSSKKGFEFSVE
ncbi:MAG: hypothetical protein CXT78_12870 [Thaumarchaeota archaeon]|jgi:hypothetical protein|nr:MAG: hypothetical protein CXT78_12870 [Nitrososphaerota archaeon]